VPASAPTPATTAPAAGGRGAPTPTPGAPTAPGDSTAAPGGAAGGGRGGAANAAPRPYPQVIRGADLRSKSGLFKTHRIGDSLFYEIPRGELNHDMLLTTEIEKTPQGVGYGGQAISEHLIRWERRDNRILLRGISEGITASDS